MPKKVSDLIKRFNIDCLPYQLHKLLPAEVSSELCPNCCSAMILPRISKWRIETNSRMACAAYNAIITKQECVPVPIVERLANNIKKPRSPLPTLHCLINHSHIKPPIYLWNKPSRFVFWYGCYGTAKIKNSMTLPSKISTMPFAPSSGYGEDLLSRLNRSWVA